MTTRGQIDSTSVHTLISALGKPIDHWTPWVWRTLLGVTSALSCTDSIEIAPDPNPHRGARGHLTEVLNAFGGTVRLSHSRDASAVQKTRRWVRENPERVRDRFQQTQRDTSYRAFEDWFVGDWWVHHIQMHGALFTEQFIPEISSVLAVNEQDLRKVHELSRDVRVVRDWRKTEPQTEDSRIARLAYILASQLRGRYHDHVARDSRMQIMHHPIRRSFVLRVANPVGLFLSNTEFYIASIVVAGSRAEKGLRQRLNLWTENVRKLRRGISAGALDLRHVEKQELALERAIEHAKRCGIVVCSRTVENTINALSAIAVAGLTSLVLTPWWGFAVGSAGGIAMAKAGVGARVSRLATTRRRLRALADSAPGHLWFELRDG